ncbi:MAG: type IX secretion system membrane protein PorP/SprF [Bacteroidales bacterium]|nr:type IX secretion system membrane protein PorP/SprF [Bacteroidales bacterium]
MKRIVYIILAGCAVAWLNPMKTSAQVEPDFTLYRQLAGYYNPSLVSNAKYAFQVATAFSLNNQGMYRKDPQLFASASLRINKLKGILSFSYLYDPYSYFTQNWVSAGYSTMFKLRKHHRILLGARLSLAATYLEPDKLIGLASNPDYSGKKVMKIKPDMDLGIAYRFYGGTLAMGIKHLLSPTVNSEGLTFVTNPTAFYILAAYDIPVKDVTISPSLFITKTIHWDYKGTVAISYKSFVTLGGTLGFPSMRVKGFIGTKAVKGLSIFLAYDSGILDEIRNGEIFLQYVNR